MRMKAKTKPFRRLIAFDPINNGALLALMRYEHLNATAAIHMAIKEAARARGLWDNVLRANEEQPTSHD